MTTKPHWLTAALSESSAGEGHRSAKLNNDRVREIRQHDDPELDDHFAALFGVSKITIRKVRKRLRWAHVPDDKPIEKA